jgi:hypothetical protein
VNWHVCRTRFFGNLRTKRPEHTLLKCKTYRFYQIEKITLIRFLILIGYVRIVFILFGSWKNCIFQECPGIEEDHYWRRWNDHNTALSQSMRLGCVYSLSLPHFIMLYPVIHFEVSCLVNSAFEYELASSALHKKARLLSVPIVVADFLTQCVQTRRRLDPFSLQHLYGKYTPEEAIVCFVLY